LVRRGWDVTFDSSIRCIRFQAALRCSELVLRSVELCRQPLFLALVVGFLDCPRAAFGLRIEPTRFQLFMMKMQTSRLNPILRLYSENSKYLELQRSQVRLHRDDPLYDGCLLSRRCLSRCRRIAGSQLVTADYPPTCRDLRPTGRWEALVTRVGACRPNLVLALSKEEICREGVW